MKNAIFIILSCFLIAIIVSPALLLADNEENGNYGESTELEKKAAERLREESKKAAENLREERKKAAERLREESKNAAEKLREDRKKAAERLREESKKTAERFRNEQAKKNLLKQTKKKIEIIDHRIKQIEEKIRRTQKELAELLRQKEKLLAVLNNSNTDKTAPIISSVSVNSVASTTATISWLTGESSDSIVKYGTSTANYIFTKDGIQTGTTTPFTHAVNLKDLTPRTIYYFIVSSKDNSGNIATSSEDFFTTLSSM